MNKTLCAAGILRTAETEKAGLLHQRCGSPVFKMFSKHHVIYTEYR